MERSCKMHTEFALGSTHMSAGDTFDCEGRNTDIKRQNYFLDGTKIEASANKYTFVWNKSVFIIMEPNVLWENGGDGNE